MGDVLCSLHMKGLHLSLFEWAQRCKIYVLGTLCPTTIDEHDIFYEL